MHRRDQGATPCLYTLRQASQQLDVAPFTGPPDRRAKLCPGCYQASGRLDQWLRSTPHRVLHRPGSDRLLLVEPCEVTLQLLTQVSAISEGLQVDALVLHAAPEPLHEDVVLVTTLAVHADPNIMGLQHLGDGLAGELAALDALLRVKWRFVPVDLPDDGCTSL